MVQACGGCCCWRALTPAGARWQGQVAGLLVQEDIYPEFMKRVIARTEAIVTGDPLDSSSMMGAQVMGWDGMG